MTTVTAVKREIIPCKLHCKKIHADISLPALSEIFSALKLPAILGGNPARIDSGRFSYWMAEPLEVFEFRTGDKDPFGKLDKILSKYSLPDQQPFFDSPQRLATSDQRPFIGGWAGYFSYELGRYIEDLPQTAQDDLQMPLIHLRFYDKVICYDHAENTYRLTALQMPDETQKPQDKLAFLKTLLDRACRSSPKPPPPAGTGIADIAKFRCNMDKVHYLKTVKKIKEYIRDGEVYQINFSQRFESMFNGRPIDLFHWQNLYNPSGYAAYIGGGDHQIVSASPEMFATAAGGIIRTKPIKGTRPRIAGIDPASLQADQKNFDELVNSEKEQAELNMIIDLERNDLGRICKYVTIKVTQPRTIESYPTVFHAVATVEGQLREKISFCDILRAMFPGGSITGAPKVSAMKIIDQTEPTARGVYTGSIGYIGIDGDVSLNIAIRTIIIKGDKAFAQTGGGIVADSDPDAEWEETLVKARALLAGIQSVSGK